MPEHLTAPLTLAAGVFQTCEQDTVDELRTTVFVICSFEVGSREEDPYFGLEPLELSSEPIDTDAVSTAIGAYESRGQVDVSEAPYDPADPGAARLRVEVSMPEEDEMEELE